MLFALFCGQSSAASPTVESVSPAVGQRGTEFTLTLAGARLDRPEELMLYAPGVSCTKLAAKSENEVAVTLKAAADCKLGEYAFRLRTPGGASELRTFRVTPFPVVTEQEPNDEKPQAVALNVSVAGVTESGGTDNFAVTLKKGQRLSAEVEGVRLGGELNDTAITVFSPDGRELATADDTPLFRQDPLVSIVAPADGEYVVQVRETNYGGGDTHRYVLHVGTFARPAAVFPAGGQAGTETTVKLLGDAGELTQTLKLPASGAFEFYPSAGDAPPAPTPNPFRVSPFPNVIEAEPNDEPGQANAAVPWPVAFNGIVEKPGDADNFRFSAKRGDEIDVQAFAYRIGSPLDPVVAVLDARGALVAANDDDETHDSRVKVTIPADGEYFVRVTDKRRQGGPRFIYRVELAKPHPSLAVFFPALTRKTQERAVIAIPRGNRVVAHVAVRRDGVSGPVAVTPGDLPAGVRVNLPPIPAGEYFVPVVFEAAADAPVGGRLVAFTGTCGDVTGGFSQVVTLTAAPGDAAFHAVELSRLAVVVTEEAPFAVNVARPAVPLVPDSTLDVTVSVARAKDFADPVEVFFPCLPPGVEAPASVVIPADRAEAVVTLVAHPTAELGEWRLVAEAQVAGPGRAGRDPLSVGMNGLGTPGGGERRPRRKAEGLPPVASGVVAMTVAKPLLSGAFAPAAGEQAKSVTVVCKLAAPTPVGSAFTAKLDSLPPRATAQPVVVKPGATEVAFAVAIDATTPAGDHRSLVCELAGTVGGEKVVYRLGRGAALKIDAPGAVKTDASGKPLSPLEVLRMKDKKE
ncbi:MAG TPA: PPC domain-containing protein [Gemmata sp.]|nr:PPC domain-containing protein [Gemmata sp.]